MAKVKVARHVAVLAMPSSGFNNSRRGFLICCESDCRVRELRFVGGYPGELFVCARIETQRCRAESQDLQLKLCACRQWVRRISYLRAGVSLQAPVINAHDPPTLSEGMGRMQPNEQGQFYNE
jgi:hypothetical protein